MPPRTRQARSGAASRARRGRYRASKRNAVRAAKTRRSRASSPRGAGHSGSGYINRRSSEWRAATGRAINRNR